MDAPLRDILCSVFDRYVGQELTVDLAARMGAEVLHTVYPGPVDISGIEPLRVGSYVIGPARLRDVLSELRGIHLAHWNETEGYRHGLPFNPDYKRGLDLEAQGRYFLLVALHLDTKQLVGNYGLYLNRSMHTQTLMATALMATEDTLFIADGHRKGRLGVGMIRFAEQALRQLGVQELNVSVKLTNDVGQMIERMGYRPVAKQYAKVLMEDANVRA